MIFSEEVSGYRDGWFDSPDELLDYLEDEEECNKPEFAFLGRKCVNQLNMDRAIERMTEDTYEDAELHITPEDMGKLSEAVDAFNAKYALTYFEHDYKRKVRIVHQVAAAPMAEPDDCKAKPDESLTIADEATTYRRIVPMGGEMYREIDEPIADEATDTKVDD
jgi:hypothetical protein